MRAFILKLNTLKSHLILLTLTWRHGAQQSGVSPRSKPVWMEEEDEEKKDEEEKEKRRLRASDRGGMEELFRSPSCITACD